MSVHNIRTAITLSAAAAALARCGSAPDLPAGKSPSQMLSQAVTDLKTAPAFEMTGTMTEPGQTIDVQPAYKPGTGCRGTLSVKGQGSIALTAIGTTASFRPDSQFWKPEEQGANSATVAQTGAAADAQTVIRAVQRKYLTTSTSDASMASFSALCSPQDLTAGPGSRSEFCHENGGDR
jgi:hypothetical protein